MIETYIFLCGICALLILCNIRLSKNHLLLSSNDTTIIKGIAALGVMLAHYASWMERDIGIAENSFFFVPKQLGGMGVLIFFFISGYGLWFSAKKADVNFRYLCRRILGVYMPYTIIRIIVEPLNYFINSWKSELIGKIFWRIFGFSLDDWFVIAILVEYVVFWIACRWIPKYKIIGTTFLTIIVMSSFIILKFDNRLYNGLLLFPFGMFIAKYQQQLVNYLNKNYYVKIIIYFVLFGFSGIIFLLNKGTLISDLFKTLSGVLLCILIIFVFQKLQIKSLILTWIGKRSLYVYITHVHLWFLFIEQMQKKRPCILLLEIILTFIITWVCSKIYFTIDTFVCTKINVKDQ